MIDKRTNFYRLKTMLEKWPNSEIALNQLKALIAMNIATSPKLIENSVKVMAMTGLIKDIGNFRFRIIKENETIN